MKNTKKSAFTIVELVIVIAVIAILSAVLIPTFGSIIKDATIAADQANAAMLNTELQSYLLGEKIDSEAELMEVLDISDIGRKLTPKAMANGYYYWFHMASQKLILAKTSEIEAMEATKLNLPTDGPAAVSAVAISDSEEREYANIDSFRDVFDNGYYFVSCTNGDGFGLSEAISFIDELKSARDYENLIKFFEYEIRFSADTSAAEAIFNKVKDTTIRTNYGGFFHENDSVYEYFSPKANHLVGTYFNYSGGKVESGITKAPVPSSAHKIKLPENIKTVNKYGLFYNKPNNVNLMTVEMTSLESVFKTFTIQSINAYIEVEGKTYHVASNNKQIKLNGKGSAVGVQIDGVTVKNFEDRLPFEEMYVGYESANDGTTAHTTVANSKQIDKIYVAYGNGRLDLNVYNQNDSNDTCYSNITWSVVSSENCELLLEPNEKSSNVFTPGTNILNLNKLNYIEKDGKYVCELTVKAAAKNSNYKDRSATVTIVVIKPVDATIKFAGKEFKYDETSMYPLLSYANPSDSFNLSAYVTYSTDSNGNNPLVLSNDFEIDTNDNKLVGLRYDGNKMSFKTNANGDLVCGTDRDGKPIYSFDISFDGCLKTTIQANISDVSEAPVRFNYKKYNQANCPTYKFGTEKEIKLSDLFNLSDAVKSTDGKAKITIYYTASATGNVDPSDEINKAFAEYADAYKDNPTSNPLTLNIKYDKEVSFNKWEEYSITLDGTVPTENSPYNIHIEIAPDGDVSTVVKVDVVNGAINESNLTDISADANGKITFTSDVVLHGNSEITTGTAIDVGAYTLHGNGYVINAEEYKASLIAESVEEKCDWCKTCKTFKSQCSNKEKPGYHNNNDLSEIKTVTSPHYAVDVALIDVNGGTIDNIYINGPVYPEMQYIANDCILENRDGHYAHANTAYFVSGIKTTGNATISNSYVSGFRQPVRVAGTAATGTITPNATNDDATVNVETKADETYIYNTTLRGGNYCNLNIASGNVKLEDVTTIQDFYGMTPTVDYNKAEDFAVYGAGIMLDGTTAPDYERYQKNALAIADAYAAKNGTDDSDKENKRRAKITELLRPFSTKVDIDGYLTQHNWIEKDLGNKKVPEIDIYNGKSVDMKFVFDSIFYGVGVKGTDANAGRMGRFMDFIHQDKPVAGAENEANRITNTYYKYGVADPTRNKNELINLGIIFADIEQSINDNVTTAKYVSDMVHIDEGDRKSGGVLKTTSLQLTEDLKIGSNSVADMLTDGADASLSIWSYTDGRKWSENSRESRTIATKTFDYHSYTTNTNTNWDEVIIVTNSDKHYSPNALYGSNGAYSAWYGSKN